MQEHPTRLTADIVKGKLDVRQAAANLPDLPVAAADSALDDTHEEFKAEEE